MLKWSFGTFFYDYLWHEKRARANLYLARFNIVKMILKQTKNIYKNLVKSDLKMQWQSVTRNQFRIFDDFTWLDILLLLLCGCRV